MNHKRMFAALLALLMALVVVGIAWAKSPCNKGYDQWWHELGNGKVQCQCFSHAKPPHNPEWHRGCHTSSDGDPATTGDQPALEDNSSGGDSNVAAITRLGMYNRATKSIVVYTVGSVGSFRLRQYGKRGVMWFDVPNDYTAIDLSEHRSTLVVGNLSPGTYFLFAHQWQTRNSGDDGERFIVP